MFQNFPEDPLILKYGEHQRFLQQIRREDEVTRDLRARGAALSSEMHTLTRLVHVSGNNAKILQDKIAQAKQLIDETKQEGVPEVDQCLVAQNVVYNQLYDAVTQELAIEDTIYALGKALETERLSMDDFLKVTLTILFRSNY
ncbi:Predicted protein [Taphrina deformans PYCC 5710]|uniref:SB domain-containing protein n=1 Tax=Taphrina deformans (strain PYCC 5710 / ATCC 11124 / CBS 356.35 / IMI 108563 / JCM 9778 / NBRC 8474) TaxID=1097556 RepID=R4XD82_TAPDE|nr:Predicted protein [Taphrina deformans PYCC 5710]|eukprot:CCG83553.1 Predicted protein [Taphrina deformans PYCC 5710]